MMLMLSNTLKEAMVATTVVNRMVGEIMGSVILKKVRHLGVSSISAASYTLAGMFCSAAMISST